MNFDTKPLTGGPFDDAFEINTQWIVITGAPSAGKSTVLNYLRRLGYPCSAEAARSLIEIGKSRSIMTRDNEADFQLDVTAFKLEIEATLDPGKLHFLDRGMPDSITFYRVSGLDPNQAVDVCLKYRYKKVFLFERLPIVKDGIRIESDETASWIEDRLALDYRALGYKVIFVPVLDVLNRVNFVFKRL